MRVSKLKTILLSIFLTIPLLSESVFADTIDGSDIHQLGGVLKSLIQLLLGIVGAFIVILIVIGGIRYILSAGNEKAMAAARNSITFAIIGFIIVVLAVVIVSFLGNLILGPGNSLTTIKIGP